MHRKTSSFAVFTLSLALAFSGCSKMADQAAVNKALTMEAFEALNNRAYQTLDQYLAKDYVRHCQATPDAPLITSLGDFVAMAKTWDASFPDAQMTVHQLIAEGDLVAFYVTYSGTQTGPMGPFPPTGKRMDSECFGYHRIENGRIVETWTSWDNLAALTQLGLFPPPVGESAAPKDE